MIDRLLEDRLIKLADWFPVVSLTGPRQSGKSTLIKKAFPSYVYINLENPEVRNAAQQDPVGFIKNRPDRLIIDEAQYVPELFNMIQVASDERGSVGQYVLSGSQNFLLLKSIQQSLAGRVGLLTLLPFSYAELCRAHQRDNDAINLDTFMLTGGYPRIYDTGMPRDVFLSNYVSTYIERDAGEMLNVRNLSQFRTLLGLLAHSVGALINYASLAADVGVDVRTIKSWISILESSYIIFQLQPYFKNGRKRLTKAPKLYFYDTGLLCSLLQIAEASQLVDHPLRGEIVENLIISERIKQHLNCGEEPALYFYRDESKREIDLLDMTDAAAPLAVEIKSGATYRSNFARHLGTVGDELGIPEEGRYVVYRGSERYRADRVTVVPAEQFVLQSM